MQDECVTEESSGAEDEKDAENEKEQKKNEKLKETEEEEEEQEEEEDEEKESEEEEEAVTEEEEEGDDEEEEEEEKQNDKLEFEPSKDSGALMSQMLLKPQRVEPMRLTPPPPPPDPNITGNPVVVDEALQQVLNNDSELTEVNLNNIDDISQVWIQTQESQELIYIRNVAIYCYWQQWYFKKWSDDKMV